MNPARFTRTVLLGVVLSITLTACANLAPGYERPAAPVAAVWPTQTSEPGTVPVDDLDWKEFTETSACASSSPWR